MELHFTDKASVFFKTRNKELTVRNWSDDFNMSDNWARLNFLMSICSYFETFLASVITESIESDPGLIFGCHHDIDGILLLKKNHKISKEETESRVINCTKGDWNSRLANFRTLYGHIPTSIQQNVSQLEKIRKLRNEVGHAFG